MPTRLVHLAVDSADPSRIARFWTAVFGWEVSEEEPGAVPVDVGQGEVSWQVFADPEGNEFCLLTPR